MEAPHAHAASPSPWRGSGRPGEQGSLRASGLKRAVKVRSIAVTERQMCGDGNNQQRVCLDSHLRRVRSTGAVSTLAGRGTYPQARMGWPSTSINPSIPSRAPRIGTVRMPAPPLPSAGDPSFLGTHPSTRAIIHPSIHPPIHIVCRYIHTTRPSSERVREVAGCLID